MDIRQPDGTTFHPDEKYERKGKQLADYDFEFSLPKTLCLTVDKTGAPRERSLNIHGYVWLNVHYPKAFSDHWNIRFVVPFEHDPISVVGIGPTRDGETFSDNVSDFNISAGETQESLLITEIPYDLVFWYLKAPNDDSTYGTVIEVDEGGEDVKIATMSYTFPDEIEVEGSYIITAYIYGSDHNIYEYCYSIWVTN